MVNTVEAGTDTIGLVRSEAVTLVTVPLTVTRIMMTATLIDIATDDHLETGGSHVMNRDNADVIHQMSSEIAIEAEVVVDDRGHT